MLESPWQITLLGGFEIRQRSREASPATTNQMALLLAMLADPIGRQHLRADLVEELWPGDDDEASRNRFRVLLAAMRRVLEPPGTPVGSVLSSDRTLVSLSSSACRVDVDEFQKHIQKGNQSPSREIRIQQYKTADSLYGGDFMSGRAGDWIFARRSFFSRQQSLAQFRLSALLEESGDIAAAMQQIARSIEADPLREAPRRRALRLLVESGDIGSALAEYEEYRKLLKRSVGLVPTSEFQDWIKGLKSWVGPTGASRSLDDGATEGELTESQLVQPETSGRVFLPPALTTFVGRSADIAELSELLRLYRWTTLTGPGGIGKTRLAIETARANALQFGGGVFYVPVGDASSPSMLLETILQQIQLVPSTDPLDTLRRYLAQPVATGRNACLFVLDCIDQLSNDINEVILRLLSEIPNATILATARKGRGATGEHEFPIGPLEVPDSEMRLDQLLANASVQLFFERAQATSARFSVTRANAIDVIALCRRLEGIPLAIELAAAQAGKESPSTILQKLSDLGSLHDPKGWREPRHRSLLASLAFSFDSLDSNEKSLFCSLCVFRGSFEAVGAQMVAGASSDDLARLAGHSLLIRNSDPEGRRYSMLDMVREFGWAKLSTLERGAVQERHASYFHQLVADVEVLHLSSGIQQLPRLRLEIENIRTAADWTLRKKDVESASKVALSLVSLWVYAGFQQEGRDTIRRIRETQVLNELQAARLNSAEGILACFQEDAETGRDRITRALPVFEALNLTLHAAGARWALAYAAYLAGDYEECLSYAQQMEHLPGQSKGRLYAYGRNLLGFASCELGRLDEAEEILREAQQRWRDLGDLLFVDYCSLNLARVTWKRGQLDEAWGEYQDVAAAFGKWNDPRGMAYATEGLGRVAADLGRFSQSARLLGAAQRLRESIGLRRDFADERAFGVAVAASRQALGAAYESEWQAGNGVAPDKVAAWVAGLDSSQK